MNWAHVLHIPVMAETAGWLQVLSVEERFKEHLPRNMQLAWHVTGIRT